MAGYKETSRAVENARTTLIDTLRLVDSFRWDEAAIGCAMALAFLAPITSERRVLELAAEIRNGKDRDAR